MATARSRIFAATAQSKQSDDPRYSNGFASSRKPQVGVAVERQARCQRVRERNATRAANTSH